MSKSIQSNTYKCRNLSRWGSVAHPSHPPRVTRDKKKGTKTLNMFQIVKLSSENKTIQKGKKMPNAL